MDDDTRATVKDLLQQSRWAALATLGADGPLGSMVGYAVDSVSGSFLLHLSQLAQHVRNMLQEPRVSLAISEPDDGRDDPQTLARISVQANAIPLDRASSGYEAGRRCYQSRFPASAQRFGFADFILFGLQPTEARFVGGFAKTMTLSGAEFTQLLRQIASGSA